MSAVLESPPQQQAPAFKVEAVVAKYIENRDLIAKLNAETKARTDAIEKQQQVIEGWLHQKLLLDGVESFKTEHGTAFVVDKDFASVADKNAVIQYVKENDAFNILTISVNKTAVKEFIAENNVPPPGVNYTMQQVVQIRRGK